MLLILQHQLACLNFYFSPQIVIIYRLIFKYYCIKVFTPFWCELLSHSCSVFQLSNVIRKTQKPKKLIRPQTSHGGPLYISTMYYITQEMNSYVCNFLRMFLDPFLSTFAIFLSIWRRLYKFKVWPQPRSVKNGRHTEVRG